MPNFERNITKTEANIIENYVTYISFLLLMSLGIPVSEARSSTNINSYNQPVIYHQFDRYHQYGTYADLNWYQTPHRSQTNQNATWDGHEWA